MINSRFIIFYFVLMILFTQIISSNSSIDIAKVFTDIYTYNKWQNHESVSGSGSTMEKTNSIRKYLVDICQKFNIQTIIDAPCGDFNWMRSVLPKLNIKQYLGIDIVHSIIEKNNKLYSSSNVNFFCRDITNDSIPRVDLIICRDCLVHLDYNNIIQALKNFKQSRSKYLLMTSFCGERKFKNIKIGSWRPINFQLAPFCFPNPIDTCNELFGGLFEDKIIALWDLAVINI
jgi:hypothetical protein